jgi:glycosyltransferase involved in cell wall biosynthesis
MTASHGGSNEASADGGRIRVATLLSCPVKPGSGLGTFLLGLFERLKQQPDLELLLITPEQERGAAGQRGSQLALAWRQLSELRRARPDVVHVHDHPVLLGAAVLYRLLETGRPRVIFSSHLDLATPRARWKRLVLGWLMARCAAVTVVSRNSAEKLSMMAEPIPAADVVRIVPGAASVVVREKSDPAVRAYAASIGHHDGPVILQVSNFVYPAKVAGTIRLLEALVQIRGRIPNVRLVVLGTGPLVGQVHAERDRLKLADAATIPGTFVEDLSLPANLCDVHCHITGQDACPISILEAMHAAKPVVASRVGGIPEILDTGVSGILVDDDAGRIARAVIELLENPEAARDMGMRGQVVAQSG